MKGALFQPGVGWSGIGITNPAFGAPGAPYFLLALFEEKVWDHIGAKRRPISKTPISARKEGREVEKSAIPMRTQRSAWGTSDLYSSREFSCFVQDNRDFCTDCGRDLCHHFSDLVRSSHLPGWKAISA